MILNDTYNMSLIGPHIVQHMDAGGKKNFPLVSKSWNSGYSMWMWNNFTAHLLRTFSDRQDRNTLIQKMCVIPINEEERSHTVIQIISQFALLRLLKLETKIRNACLPLKFSKIMWQAIFVNCEKYNKKDFEKIGTHLRGIAPERCKVMLQAAFPDILKTINQIKDDIFVKDRCLLSLATQLTLLNFFDLEEVALNHLECDWTLEEYLQNKNAFLEKKAALIAKKVTLPGISEDKAIIESLEDLKKDPVNFSDYFMAICDRINMLANPEAHMTPLQNLSYRIILHLKLEDINSFFRSFATLQSEKVSSIFLGNLMPKFEDPDFAIQILQAVRGFPLSSFKSFLMTWICGTLLQTAGFLETHLTLSERIFDLFVTSNVYYNEHSRHALLGKLMTPFIYFLKRKKAGEKEKIENIAKFENMIATLYYREILNIINSPEALSTPGFFDDLPAKLVKQLDEETLPSFFTAMSTVQSPGLRLTLLKEFPKKFEESFFYKLLDGINALPTSESRSLFLEWFCLHISRDAPSIGLMGEIGKLTEISKLEDEETRYALLIETFFSFTDLFIL